MQIVLWWVRRDLRLRDNQALNSALEAAEQVVPVFVLDPTLLKSVYVGEKRMAFLIAGLRQLDEDLRKSGSYLVVRLGDPQEQLGQVMHESQAEAIYAEADYSPYARRRDQRIEQALPLVWIGSPAVKPPGSVLKANSEPYSVFTAFSRNWKSLPGPNPGMSFDRPARISTPKGLRSEALPDHPVLPEGFPFVAGEAEAQSRLHRFTQAVPEEEVSPRAPIFDYASGRNRLDLEGTAQLSPYLRFGMLSARQALVAAMQAIEVAADPEARNSAEMWMNELIWREFYIHILFHFPRVRRENFRLPHVRWLNDTQQFEAWCEGRTGYPVVDAAMRQMLGMGWMHNRARMIVASFLTKDLLIDWRWGERWFMQHLVDGDPAANNGGWQWTAGTGTDAAPYFRIFNPVSQSLKHDPQGAYIRRWVPILRQVPDEFVHEPWKMPVEVQKAAGCVIGVDYPQPLVDHQAAKARTMRAYSN